MSILSLPLPTSSHGEGEIPTPGKTPDVYWERTEDSYPHYPTVRHRKRFILRTLRALNVSSVDSIFDFGCGEGALLLDVMAQTGIEAAGIGGSDISVYAIQQVRKKIHSLYFYTEAFAETDAKFSVIICSELIEHTVEYASVLQWISSHLTPGGSMVLTTQSGKIHNSDLYTGHTQHFQMRKLVHHIEQAGMDIVTSRLWGFPFFTLQKYLTDFSFNTIREQYLEGAMTWKKKLLFAVAYCVYFLHDCIPYGPQIYIVARKKDDVHHKRSH